MEHVKIVVHFLTVDEFKQAVLDVNEHSHMDCKIVNERESDRHTIFTVEVKDCLTSYHIGRRFGQLMNE